MVAIDEGNYLQGTATVAANHEHFFPLNKWTVETVADIAYKTAQSARDNAPIAQAPVLAPLEAALIRVP